MEEGVLVREGTHADDGWVIRNSRGLVLLDARVVLDSQVLHITASEDDVLVHLVGGRNLFVWPAFTAFCSEGPHILERHC